jgi:hypothetical protein
MNGGEEDARKSLCVCRSKSPDLHGVRLAHALSAF